MNRYQISLKGGHEVFIESPKNITEIVKEMKETGCFYTDKELIRAEYIAAIIKVKERELTEDEIKEKLRGK